ncbi:MAG: hypothetical protein RLP44_11895 [Aggregatilineales bacterium]
MSDMYAETYPPKPPPLNYDNFEPPPDDYDPTLDYVPFGIPDDYAPDDLRNLPDVPPPSQDGLQGFESPEPEDEAWSWHDARIIGIDRGENRYEIGAIDLYANADTGDLGGSYLPIATFSDEAPAVAYYHQIQQEIHEQGLPAFQVADFAERQAFTMNPEPENWRGAEPDEYAAYEYVRDLEAFDPALADDPPDDAIDPLIQTAIELGGVVVEPKVDETTFRALDAIGVQAENFDPSTNPPPFYDADTGTAYWIGVFQPDKDDRENCVTSILSLGRDPETGEMEAQLAPCVPGDWDKTYSAAEYLIQTANRGGIEQLFDTAEGMALATDQRELWETERGVPLEADATRELADFTQWEVER